MSEHQPITSDQVLQCLLKPLIPTPSEEIISDEQWDPNLGESFGRHLFESFNNHIYPYEPKLPKDPELKECIKKLETIYLFIHFSDAREYGEFGLLLDDDYLHELFSDTDDATAHIATEYYHGVLRGYGFSLLDEGEFSVSLRMIERGTNGGILADEKVRGKVKETIGSDLFSRLAFSEVIAEEMNLRQRKG